MTDAAGTGHGHVDVPAIARSLDDGMPGPIRCTTKRGIILLRSAHNCWRSSSHAVTFLSFSCLFHIHPLYLFPRTDIPVFLRLTGAVMYTMYIEASKVDRARGQAFEPQ